MFVACFGIAKRDLAEPWGMDLTEAAKCDKRVCQTNDSFCCRWSTHFAVTVCFPL